MRALVLVGVFLLSSCGSAPRKPTERLASARARLSSEDAAIRTRAAWEMGQLGLIEFPEGEPEPPAAASVREAAAAALVPMVSDPAPAVRRAAVEGLGKTGGADIEDLLLSAATDVDPGVRGDISLALFRRRFLKRVPEYSTASVSRLLILAGDPEPEVRWRAVYAFTRFPDPRAEKTLRTAQADPSALVRLFAVRALAKLGIAADPQRFADSDLYVRAEAAASYGAAKEGASLPVTAFTDPSAHVRAAAADAIAATGNPALASKLETMADSDGPLARGRALLALAKLRGDAENERLARARRDPSWWIRARAYEASAALSKADEVLTVGVSDSDARVAAQALESLAASTSSLAGTALVKVLNTDGADLELLGTAVEGAGAHKSAAMTEALRAAWGRPGLTAEVRDSLRQALKTAGVEVKAGPGLDAPKTFPPLSSSPTLVLETARGTVEILLDAQAAPNTAAAVADAARRGVYDGTIWHRVVTAFVVQGGDPRGSGWGDDGFRLVDEVNPRPFLRGTLGMPKAGPDTGGCQLFVSLVPTPHLDGRYTAFGRVVSGMDALDALEPGDLIRSARLR